MMKVMFSAIARSVVDLQTIYVFYFYENFHFHFTPTKSFYTLIPFIAYIFQAPLEQNGLIKDSWT